jgi:aspartyl-tRNA synthetase
MLRTHTCGELTKDNNGSEVILCGWVHRRRDHGGLIFVDLRDRYGFTQIVFDPKECPKEIFGEAERIRPEWVLKVTGKVRLRVEGAAREDNPTGAIEVLASAIQVFSEAKTPPFEIDRPSPAAAGLRPASQGGEINEELRLQYRFLDLRRAHMQEMLQKRHRFIAHIRAYMSEQGFTEVQTPILANSSPEGARDYLVPSRLHRGQFYALPQAPQQFKQLLMVAGLDRYFQIAPCFRDEDPRADRHPGEFYQLDLEMSFVEQEDVFSVVEPLMIELAEQHGDKKVLHKPFPRIPWKQIMTRYGSDKPDLRFDFEIRPITDLVRGCGFKVFADAAASDGVVHALCIPGGGDISRKDIDELTELAKVHHAKGLAYIVVKDPSTSSGQVELQSPIVKFLGDDLAQKIVQEVGAKPGDIIFFGADTWLTVCTSLGAVRDAMGRRLGLKDSSKAAWGWVTDFPMYEWNEQEKKIDFSHNPFSMPQGGMDALNSKDPLDILGYQYDLFCNGFEISSGAIRNYRPDIMYRAFDIAGYTKKEVDAKFGGMIRAFQYGAPPHGGFAPGIDRLMMVLWEYPSIRDIYAFPKNGKAQDVMMGAPSTVSDKQLEELGITVVEE